MRLLGLAFALTILFISNLMLGTQSYAEDQDVCFPLILNRVHVNEDDLQVNAVKLGKYFISHSMDSYFVDGRVMLPVYQVGEIIGLEVFKSGDVIEISHPQSTCKLDIQLKRSPFDPGIPSKDKGRALWTQDEFDTYLDVAFLEAIFQGSSNIDFAEQLVHVQTGAEIKPIGQSKTKSGTNFSSIKPEYSIADQYHFSTFPSADLNLSYSYDDESSSSDYDARLNAYFDSFYQGTELRLNHNDTNNSQRLKFFRDFRLGATNAPISNVGYELGDIFTTPDNLVASTNLGAGIHLFTGTKNQFNAFNSISIQETVSPGWRGELYRNGQFVTAQNATNENQLIFNNVPAFFGFNRYELRLFGPDGQQETRIRNYQMGKEQLVENKFDIELYSISPGKNFIDEDNAGNLPFTRADKLGISYGFSPDLTAGFSVQSLENNTTGENQQFVTTSLYKQYGPGAFNIELGAEMGEGFAIFGGYSGYWLDRYNVSLDVSHFDDFNSQIRPDSSSLESQVRGRISGSSDLWGGLGWSASLAHQFNRDTDDNFQALFSATKSISGGALSSSFSYNQKEGFDRTFNNLYWVQNFDFASISVGLNWYPFDNFDVRSSNVEARWATNSKLFQISRLLYQPDVENKYSLNHQLNWRTRHFTFTSGVTVNDNGDWEFSAGFVTSIGYDYVNNAPRFSHKRSSNSGNLHLLSFLDRDRNGILSSGDRPLPNVKFAGNSDWRHTETNQYGQAVLMGASTSGQQHIAVDLASLKDPFLFPKYEKLSVKTHPGGLNRIMLPVLSFSDLEGSVYLQSRLGARAIMGAPVQLMQGENVIASTHTESDGYYAFSKVPPGEYTVDIGKDYLGIKSWAIKSMPTIINVDEVGDVIWLSDMILNRAGQSSAIKSAIRKSASKSIGSDRVVESEKRQFSVVSENDQYFVQIGVFKKARSAPVILDAMPKDEEGAIFPTRIFRNAKSGVSFIVAGPFKDKGDAAKALGMIREEKSLSKSFVVSSSKFNSSDYSVQTSNAEVKELSKNFNPKLERLNALRGQYLCQLASYRDINNIDSKLLQQADDLVVVKKQVDSQTYYTLILMPRPNADRDAQFQLQSFCERTIHPSTGKRGWWRLWDN